ncbi:MAG: hypothetical protein QOI63_2026, partial [Thermoplasmata archaeon]|nr:hypothetical protein [Thermoplasmata archaeon]
LELQGRVPKEKEELHRALNAPVDPRLPASRLDQLRSLAEDDSARLADLERRVRGHQVLSRLLGLTAYVVLGGLVAGFIVTQLPLQATGQALPASLYAVAVGAAWTSYLSAIGLVDAQQSATTAVEAAFEQGKTQVDALRKEFEDALAKSKAGKLTHPEAVAQVQAVAEDRLKTLDSQSSIQRALLKRRMSR